jgi:Ca2+-binding EF-hand superfamily protein
MPQNTSAAICSMQKDLCIAIKLYAGWIGAIQDKKIELIQNHTFHPYTGFQSLDKYGSGYITVADLTQKLKDYNFPITPTEGQYLVMYKSKCLLYNRRFDAALVRDDVLTYDDFLSLISPNDRKYLADKFSFGVNKYEGVAKVLPEYTYRSLMEVFCMEVEIYREFEKLKHLLIKKHGYCARDAFNEFNKSKVEGRKLSFEDFKDAMTTCNINFLEREYRDLCSELDINSDGLVSKEEFQDLITPFDGFVELNQQKKLFNDLGPEELQVYLKNAYNYKDPHAKQKSDFKQGHAWECMMGKLDRIYNTNYDDPRHPVNRNLYKDVNGRVKYDITKKRGAGYNARGFDAYFDDYYKEKYLADKNALIHCLDDVYREERHGEKVSADRI